MKARRLGLLEKWRKISYQVPNAAFDPLYRVKIADTKEELESAFRLLSQNPKEMKCSIYTFLPQTLTVVVKYKNLVVGTMVLVKDSPLGLPSDNFYSDENNQLRKKQEQLVEIANLGIDLKFQQQRESIQHLLMKFTYQFIKRFTYGSVLLMSIRPQSEKFYTRVWNFSRLGDIIKYKSSRESFTVLLAWNLNAPVKKSWLEIFQNKELKKKVNFFLVKPDVRLIFPLLKFGQTVRPVMTPELLEYFFVTKTSVYEELNLSTRKLFLEVFLQFFGEEKIQGFLNIEREYLLKEFRTPTRAQVEIQAESQRFTGKILDISSQGCFVELNEKIKSLGDVTLSFRLGDQHLSVSGKALWRNEKQLVRYPTGYGIKFHAPKPEILHEVQSWIKAS